LSVRERKLSQTATDEELFCGIDGAHVNFTVIKIMKLGDEHILTDSIQIDGNTMREGFPDFLRQQKALRKWKGRFPQWFMTE